MKEFTIPGSEAKLRYHDLPAAAEGKHKAPILLLHGLGCAGSFDMVNVAAQPALGDRRRILPDLPGAGYSDGPEGFAYEVEDHACCLLALMDELELERFAVFGHSLGGAVALTLAALCGPERLAAVILGEGNLDPGGGPFSRHIVKWSLDDWVQGGFDEMVAQEREKHNGLWAASLEKWNPEGLWRVSRSLVSGGSPGWREVLYGLRCPRLYIFGERTLPDPDAVTLPRQGVAVEVLRNTGHSMTWENPEGLAGAIASV